MTSRHVIVIINTDIEITSKEKRITRWNDRFQEVLKFLNKTDDCLRIDS